MTIENSYQSILENLNSCPEEIVINEERKTRVSLWTTQVLDGKAPNLALLLEEVCAELSTLASCGAYWHALVSQIPETLGPQDFGSILAMIETFFCCYVTLPAHTVPRYFIADSLGEVLEGNETLATELLQAAQDPESAQRINGRAIFHRILTRLTYRDLLLTEQPPGSKPPLLSEVSGRWIAQELQDYYDWRLTAQDWQIRLFAEMYGGALEHESMWSNPPSIIGLTRKINLRADPDYCHEGLCRDRLLPSGLYFNRDVRRGRNGCIEWLGIFSFRVQEEGKIVLKRKSYPLDKDADPTGVPETRALEELIGIPCRVPAFPADVNRKDILDAILTRDETLTWLVALALCRVSFSYYQLKEHHNERNNKGVYFLLLRSLCWFYNYLDKRVDKEKSFPREPDVPFEE